MTTPITEHCGNCANARTDGQHTVCTAGNGRVGMMNQRPPIRCVCNHVADSTKPANCPGWVAVAKLTKATEVTR